MSTRTTVLKTQHEEWWTESTPEIVDGMPTRDVLTIGISKAAMLRWETDTDGLWIELRPGTPLYDALMAAKFPK